VIRAQSGRRRRGAFAAASTAALALALFCAGGAAASPAASPDGPHGLSVTAPHAPVNKAKTSTKELRHRVTAAAEQQAEENDKQAAAAGEKQPQGDKGRTAKPFIIGGTATAIQDAPWMVQLDYYNDTTGEGFFCGGALVAPDKVLTAAHCVSGYNWSAHGAVLANATGLLDDTNGTVAGVYRQWNHPKFNPNTAQSDVAVLTLDRPLKQAWLKLAASNDSSLYTPGTKGTVYGWGVTSGAEDADLSTELRSASLPVVADSTCDSAMASALGKDDFVAGSMMCAGTPASGADEGTISPCNGDSGGPLVVGGKIVGIVSWGVAGCTAQGAYPVFTKVSSYTWAAQPRIDDSDLSGDGWADLLGRVPSGNLFELDSEGTSLQQRLFVGDGWQSISWALQADLDRDGFQDLVIRDKTDGLIYRNYYDQDEQAVVWGQIGTVWGGYSSYAIPGDLTGDAVPDLLAVDSNGDTYLYPGKGDGEFNARIKVVTGSWKNVQVLGHGDLSGDGKADVLARDSSNTLWLYQGTGNASSPWKARVKARTGWNFTALVTSGDVTGDGITDLFARQPDGTMYLYPGTDTPTTDLFGPRISQGTDWNQYNLFL
jgi:Trypsin/FG-GAP-like repeat